MGIISAIPTPPDDSGSIGVDAIVQLYHQLVADDRYRQTPLEAREAEILRLEADWYQSRECKPRSRPT